MTALVVASPEGWQVSVLGWAIGEVGLVMVVVMVAMAVRMVLLMDCDDGDGDGGDGWR